MKYQPSHQNNLFVSGDLFGMNFSPFPLVSRITHWLVAQSQIDYRSTENDMGTGKEGGGVWNWIRDFSALLFVVSVEINTGQQKRNSIGGGSV